MNIIIQKAVKKTISPHVNSLNIYSSKNHCKIPYTRPEIVSYISSQIIGGGGPNIDESQNANALNS